MDVRRKGKVEKDVRHPPRPRDDELDLDALHERTMKRFPKIMARLGQAA
jgi:hypothetical protein